jgi:hypothetical protein
VARGPGREVITYRRRNDDVALCKHRERVGKRRWVGMEGARCDHRRVVVDHVRQGEHNDMTPGVASETSPFDRREVFAKRVDLVNRGAACREGRNCRDLVVQRERACWQTRERGATAREQNHQRCVVGKGGDEITSGLTSRQTAGAWGGVFAGDEAKRGRDLGIFCERRGGDHESRNRRGP